MKDLPNAACKVLYSYAAPKYSYGWLRGRIEQCEAHFDSRAFTLPNEERVVAYMRWRALHDCKRNSISMLAQAHFEHAELQGVADRLREELSEMADLRRELAAAKAPRDDAPPPPPPLRPPPPPPPPPPPLPPPSARCARSR